jgi:UDP-N-acetylmuramoyl-L-alanyl-D-glutamate--2,6-diaminopimelate ligase
MQKLKKLIPQRLKNYYHLLQAILANVIYAFPSGKITVIGVTGTNGKTTTVQMITKILEKAGRKVAMASTINFKINEKEWVNKTKFTTLSSFRVQKFISRAVSSRCQFLVLETSSHSLDQYRTWGIKYDTAIITNVTREHLDYHKTMEDYRLAKFRLFEHARTSVVNLDMKTPCDYIIYEAKNKYGYTTKEELSCEESDLQGAKIVRAKNMVLDINKSSFQVEETNFNLNIPGEFNVENALAAISAGLAYGIKLETMAEALFEIRGIPGRMEHIDNEKGLDIIVDYALTPDSLEKLYRIIDKIKAPHPESRVIAVFGSCGERDRGKRPMMGKIVDKHADYIIVTNEDPYDEDPERIINEVAGGVKNKKENENFWKISDRRIAIKKALQLAKPGDIIVVTGKGAEETMAIGKNRILWNDKNIILEELTAQKS